MMDHSGVLFELLLELPRLASCLQTAAPPLPDYGSGTLTATNPGGTKPLPPSPPPLVAPAVAEKTGLGSSGIIHMNAKPNSTKAKFSSITGPDIYYDGKSQKSLFDCSTALTAKCSVLRKEIVQIQRKIMVAQSMANYGSNDLDDELEAAAEAAESYRCRFDEERLPAEEARKEEDKSKVLERIHCSLLAAAQACEEAATDLLKGEGCIFQVDSINANMMDAADQINTTLGLHAPSGSEGFEEGLDDGVNKAANQLLEEELPHMARPPAASASALAGDDTRFRRHSARSQLAEVAR